MEIIKTFFSIEREVMTTLEFIDYSKMLLLKLKSFDKIYDDVNIISNGQNYFFSKDLSDFNFENLYSIINEDNIAYKNEDVDNKNLDRNSISWAGFTTTFFFGGKSGIYNIPDVSLTIAQGSSQDRTASISIDYSELNQNKLTKEYIIKLIKIIDQNSKLIFASVILNNFLREVRQKGQKSVGWINYSNNKRIKDYLDNKDICEITNKGIIFSISEDIPSYKDLNLVAKSQRISDLLLNLG